MDYYRKFFLKNVFIYLEVIVTTREGQGMERGREGRRRREKKIEREHKK